MGEAGSGEGGGVGWGMVRLGCEGRIEVFVKIQANFFFLGGGGDHGGWGRGAVRVDVNEELKFL